MDVIQKDLEGTLRTKQLLECSHLLDLAVFIFASFSFLFCFRFVFIFVSFRFRVRSRFVFENESKNEIEIYTQSIMLSRLICHPF